MTDLSKIKDGAFENGIPADTDFETFEAKSLARDYGLTESIDAADSVPARPIEVIEGEILFYKNMVGGAMLEIGRRLIEAKKQIPHGEWVNWLEEKVQFSVRQAQRFMRLAKEYGENDTVTHLGARKALALLALEESEREEFLSEKHEINGEEKTAQDMSAEELEEVLRLRKELQKANVKNERLEAALKNSEATISAAEANMNAALNRATMAEDAKNRMAMDLKAAKADAATAEESRKKMAEDMKLVKANLEDQKASAEKFKAAADKIGKELADLKAQPVDVAVREPTEEEIAALAAPAVEAARAESREQVRQLEKALAAAAPDTAAFKVLFEAWQETYSKMAAALERVAQADAAKADKLRGAVKAALERMGA